MTADRDIDYEALAQAAMRGMVRTVLAQVAKSGLPGEHHFYIAFNTEAPGVIISKRLKEKYPEEMTVVLQHRFWDLTVTEDRFEVKLTFDSIPERLSVPFSAIKVFFDPSVPYGLQFEDSDLVGESSSDFGVTAAEGEEGGPRPATARTAEKTPASAIARTGGATRSEKKPRAPRRARQDKTSEPASEALTEKPAAKEAPSPAPASEIPGGDSKVVRIDAFRKK